LREQQVDAQRLIVATAAALAQDADLLDADEEAAIRMAMAALQEQSDGSDHRAIHVALDKLAQATETFAARRMDRSVRQALTGRTLDEIA
jgi:molecular chaperone HscA